MAVQQAAAQLDVLDRDMDGFDASLDVALGERLSTVLSSLAPEGRLVALGFSAPFRAAGEWAGALPA